MELWARGAAVSVGDSTQQASTTLFSYATQKLSEGRIRQYIRPIKPAELNLLSKLAKLAMSSKRSFANLFGAADGNKPTHKRMHSSVIMCRPRIM